MRNPKSEKLLLHQSNRNNDDLELTRLVWPFNIKKVFIIDENRFKP